MKMRGFLTLAAALLISAPGLVAQEEGEAERPRPECREMMRMHARMHGQMQGAMEPGRMRRGGMGQGMMGGAMGGMPAQAPGPMMLLRAREALQLTDGQVERLESLHEELRQAHQAHMEQAREAAERAREALREESPDPETVESALQAASAHRIQAHMGMVRGHLRARDVLTDEQRERLAETMEMMRSLRRDRPAGPGGMRRDGTPPRPPRGEAPPPGPGGGR